MSSSSTTHSLLIQYVKTHYSRHVSCLVVFSYLSNNNNLYRRNEIKKGEVVLLTSCLINKIIIWKLMGHILQKLATRIYKNDESMVTLLNFSTRIAFRAVRTVGNNWRLKLGNNGNFWGYLLNRWTHHLWTCQTFASFVIQQIPRVIPFWKIAELYFHKLVQ